MTVSFVNNHQDIIQKESSARAQRGKKVATSTIIQVLQQLIVLQIISAKDFV